MDLAVVSHPLHAVVIYPSERLVIKEFALQNTGVLAYQRQDIKRPLAEGASFNLYISGFFGYRQLPLQLQFACSGTGGVAQADQWGACRNNFGFVGGKIIL